MRERNDTYDGMQHVGMKQAKEIAWHGRGSNFLPWMHQPAPVNCS